MLYLCPTHQLKCQTLTGCTDVQIGSSPFDSASQSYDICSDLHVSELSAECSRDACDRQGE